MDDSIFITLEKRIDALINRCSALEAANRELEISRDALLAERVNYLNQRKQVISQMESLIHKLEANQTPVAQPLDEPAEVL